MESGNKALDTLEKYLLGPMSKVAQWRIVRSVMAAGMQVYRLLLLGLCSSFLMYYPKHLLSWKDFSIILF